ncbi:MAG: Hpt domain-containing protein [Nitrospira sp.]|nr:Hpt domain-containing protein [Nitrospira sp.]
MSQDHVFDLHEALSRIDHDRETFCMMVEIFLEQGPNDLAAIQTALEQQDAAGAARAAHRLKGSALQFCADAAVEAAKAVETAGKAGDVGESAKLYRKLEAELLRLFDALRVATKKDLAA